MGVSKKIMDAIEQSLWIRKMFEEGESRKEIYGEKNVFDFSLGNPNLEPPTEFKLILQNLANDSREGLHCYTPNAGYKDTRKAVADYLTEHSSQIFTFDEIVMTVGASGALNIILKTILDPDDEVIIPIPCFMEYKNYVDNHHGVPRFIKSKPDFSLDLYKIKEVMNEKTKAVLINSPHNPTGRIYSCKELSALVSLMEQYSEKRRSPIYLISDESYKKIVFDRVLVPSITDIYKNSFIVTSFSKELSLPGERIGYVALSPAMEDREIVANGLSLCNRLLGFTNAPALMQRAITSLLNVSVDIDTYQKKRDMLCDGLASLGYEFIKPQGAFYLFPKSPISDDARFVSVLEDENILTVPGSSCGCPGYFRIAYCVADSTIINSMVGFSRAIDKFR